MVTKCAWVVNCMPGDKDMFFTGLYLSCVGKLDCVYCVF